MSRLLSRPSNAWEMPQIQHEEPELLSTDNFDLGYIPDLDPARVPINGLPLLTNSQYYRGQLFKRNGMAQYAPTKPNSNKVLNIVAFYDVTVGLAILRFDRAKIHKVISSGWSEIVPSPGAIAFTGTDQDFFSVTSADNRLFVSNNGTDPIREVDVNTLAYTALGNADRYRYICSGFNRIIAANYLAAVDIPYRLAWSGDQNYSEWDTTVDPSAGFTDLVTSPADTSDDITGVINSATVLVVPRQRSIWIGVSQPSATAPFNFYPSSYRLGMDTPRSITVTDSYGIVWFNYLTNTVYSWDPTKGNDPQPISDAISRTLRDLIIDPTYIWASYSYDTRKYSLFIADPNTSNVDEFVFDFHLKNWVRNSYPLVSCVTDLEFPNSSISIDALTGTIDTLTGTIDSLGGIVKNATKFLGLTSGDINTITSFSGIESTSVIETEDYGDGSGGYTVTQTIQLKDIEIPLEDTIFNLIRFNYTPYNEGTFSVLFYPNGDSSRATTLKTITVTAAMVGLPQIGQVKKPRRYRRGTYYISNSDVMLSLNGANVRGLKAGVSK